MTGLRTNYQHWRLETDSDSLLWLQFDAADSSINVLGREALEELEHIVSNIRNASYHGMILMSAKADGFIAGADLNEFTRIADEDEAYELARRGQLLCSAIEALSFPTLALIHGYCMGGGTELALACNYRIALDDNTTRISLPEIRLGIHPGFGGTVRILRLTGPMSAMSLMLTGRSLRARQAKRMGVVDYCVPKRLWKQSAAKTILRRPKLRRASLLQRVPNLPGIRHALAASMRKRAAKHAPPEHYPAPNALIKLWEHPACTTEDQYEAEARSAASLIVTPTAKNLVRVFYLQNRLKALSKSGNRTQHVHVIGGGTMGGGIAGWCALQGLSVTIQDHKNKNIARVKGVADSIFRKRLKPSRLVRDAHDRLYADPYGYGLSRADVVIEAVPEQLEIKQKVLTEAEARMKPEALLSSNTSSIPLEELAKALVRPERFVGLHFFNPVDKMMLVEVVRSAASSDEAMVDAMGFTRSIGKLPLPVESSPGFLINRVLMPYLLEAVTMTEEGIAPVVVDKAARQFGMPMGPIQLADMVGLDVCLLVAKILAEHFSFNVPSRLKELVQKGHLGEKTGKGFYTYRGSKQLPSIKRGPAIPKEKLSEYGDRLLMRLINESMASLREGIVADADLLDAGLVFGTGFAPFRGGPLQYVRETGVEEIVAKMTSLAEIYGGHFTPDKGWKQADTLLAVQKIE